ncbi:MAG TPA: cytochrome C [Hyphomicrobiales bacterium]|nr:cytochrome C [Hyphomicrobiales bacterium]
MKYLIAVALLLTSSLSLADEFTNEDVERWEQQYEDVAAQGRQHFTDPALGGNGVVCGQCHPNAANTHPETYPKFQKQLGKVSMLWEMINWCIRNPLQGQELAADDPVMIALQAYIAKERAGVALAPGKH